MNNTDSPGFRERKAFFNGILTLYGRNPVMEALQDPALVCYRLHLADSNKPAPALRQMEALARQRGAEVLYHNKRELSRISRNGKQDQGVAADILCPGFRSVENYLAEPYSGPPRRLVALDGITNPQNLGMLVRSTVAGGIDGIIYPEKRQQRTGTTGRKSQCRHAVSSTIAAL